MLPVAPARPRLLSLWRYLFVVLLAGTILIVREPHKIWNAQFIAEDGSIFFAQAFNFGIWETFFTRYAGYYHLIPRLLAAAGMLLPYAWIPLFYSLSALLLTALALTWFYLPQHRHLVQSDRVRLATVLILLCAPNLAALMQIAYVQWPLAVWALLVTLTPLPTKPWAAWSTVLVYLLVIGTAPVVIVWLPVWLWRLYEYQRGERRENWQRAQLLCLILAHGVIVFSGLTAPTTLPHSTAELPLLWLDFIRGFVYQAGVLNLLGRGVSEWLLEQWGWGAFYVIGFDLVVVILGLLLWQKHRQKRFVTLLLLYVIVASSLLYLTRAELFGLIFANNLGNMHRGAARYFWVASAALYLLVAIQVGTWLAYSSAFRPVLISGAGFLLVLGLYSSAFPIPGWGNVAWAPYARLLAHLQVTQRSGRPCPPSPRFVDQPEAAAGLAAQGERRLFLPLVLKPQFLPTTDLLLSVPIAPPGWVMKLTVSNTYAQLFPPGLTLVGAEEQVVDRALRVRLFWQGTLGAVIAQQQQYRITAYLIDQQGRPIASDDAPVDQPINAAQKVVELFQSQHTLAFSSALMPDRYNVAVRIHPQTDRDLRAEELIFIENCIRYHPENSS